MIFQVPISLLPVGGALQGSELVAVVQGGKTVRIPASFFAAVANQAPVIVTQLTGIFPNERALSSPGGDLNIVDHGPGLTVDVTLNPTGVTPNTYTLATVTVDSKGRIVGIANGTAGAGTVTEVDTGDGLVGGPISTSGTISIAPWVVSAVNLNVSNANKYLLDTTTAPINATLPAAPNVGDTVQFADSASKFATNNLTVLRNGNTIMGSATDLIVSTNDARFGLAYNGTTWRIV